MFYVILLALIAAFLALRLYSVLGKRTGHEQPLPPRRAEDRTPAKVLPRATTEVQPDARAGARAVDAGAEQGLRAVIAGESGFDVGQFLEGAKGAYRMTLEAFWRGDEEELRQLAVAEVADAFVEAIRERSAAGETLENRLVSIERAVVSGVSVQGREARISVQFDADVAAVTRDADGNVVAGSLTDAVDTHDVWTFARTLGDRDPNWKLADTDEA